MRQNLTEPTRKCGALGVISHQLMRNCLQRIGFSSDCIPIWEYNILNTKKECTAVSAGVDQIIMVFSCSHTVQVDKVDFLLQLCIWSWITGEDNNKPDGSLNDCLQCDEDKSGPNFKFFSGRTRRNSGIPSAIERPPEQFYDMEHCYWYGDL